MKAVQEVMERRRQQHRYHRQEEYAAEESVDDGEEFAGGRHELVHRTHAGQDHRRVQGGVEPGQIAEHVVTGRADADGGEDERADKRGVAREAAG